MHPHSHLVFFLAVCCATNLRGDDTILVTPENASGLAHLNEPIVWDVKVSDDTPGAVTTAAYDLRESGDKVIDQGTLTFTDGAAKIHGSLGEPGTILVEVTKPASAGQSAIRAVGGAAVDYDQIKLSRPCPSDFDAFWKAKLAQLATIPPNPVLTREDSGRAGVDYWKITLDNINGTHVEGQLARPSGDKKVPALLIMQWAGVYPLDKTWATERASEGWLTLNIMAHDLPIDKPKNFYDDKANNELKNYPSLGDTDRDKSYFLRMFLGDVQAARYLEQRADWDGKVLTTTGTSQGGMQSFATAALDPRITDMLVLVPGGCDNSGSLAGRRTGWPLYLSQPNDPQQNQIIQTMAYFDPVNFAPRVKAAALVATGLIDEVAPPTGVFTAFNQLQGLKEILVLPHSDHGGTGGSQGAYSQRFTEWLGALVNGKPAPVRHP